MIKLTTLARKIVLISALSTFCLSSSALTAMADNNKFAAADINKIIENSKAFQDIVKQVEKKNSTSRENIQKVEAQLKKKYQEVEAQKNVLSKEAFESKSEEIAKEAAALQKTSYNERSLLEKAYSEAIQGLSDKVLEIIKNKAQSSGYDMVMERAALPYFDEKLDITSSILEQVNSEVTSIKVNFDNSSSSNEDKKAKVDNNQSSKSAAAPSKDTATTSKK